MPTLTLRIVASVLTFILVLPVRGAQEPPEFEAPAEFGMTPIRDVAELNCEFRYPDGAIQDVAQGGTVELRLEIKSELDGPRYRLMEVKQSRVTGDLDRDYVHLASGLDETEKREGYRRVQSYDLTLRIDLDTPPRPYDVTLVFRGPDNFPESRKIRLFVGAKQGEKAEKYVEARTVTASPPRITAGTESPLTLMVANRFPTYNLRVSRITVTSNPPGLIKDIDEKLQDVIISSDGSTHIDLKIQGQRSLIRQLSPFEEEPSLNVSLWYDDGFRTNVRRVPAITFAFSHDPSSAEAAIVAICSVLIGGLLGAGVRIKFSKPPPIERRLSVTERLLWSLVLIGVLVLIVVIAQIEVLLVTAKLSVPLHKPVVVLVISFILGLYDPSELISYIRKKAGVQTAESAASGNN